MSIALATPSPDVLGTRMLVEALEVGVDWRRAGGEEDRLLCEGGDAGEADGAGGERARCDGRGGGEEEDGTVGDEEGRLVDVVSIVAFEVVGDRLDWRGGSRGKSEE